MNQYTHMKVISFQVPFLYLSFSFKLTLRESQRHQVTTFGLYVQVANFIRKISVILIITHQSLNHAPTIFSQNRMNKTFIRRAASSIHLIYVPSQVNKIVTNETLIRYNYGDVHECTIDWCYLVRVGCLATMYCCPIILAFTKMFSGSVSYTPTSDAMTSTLSLVTQYREGRKPFLS